MSSSLLVASRPGCRPISSIANSFRSGNRRSGSATIAPSVATVSGAGPAPPSRPGQLGREPLRVERRGAHHLAGKPRLIAARAGHAIDRGDVTVRADEGDHAARVRRRDGVRRMAVGPAQRARRRIEPEQEAIVVHDDGVVAEPRALALDGDAPQDVVAIDRRVLRLFGTIKVVPVERPHERAAAAPAGSRTTGATRARSPATAGTRRASRRTSPPAARARTSPPRRSTAPAPARRPSRRRAGSRTANRRGRRAGRRAPPVPPRGRSAARAASAPPACAGPARRRCRCCRACPRPCVCATT